MLFIKFSPPRVSVFPLVMWTARWLASHSSVLWTDSLIQRYTTPTTRTTADKVGSSSSCACIPALLCVATNYLSIHVEMLVLPGPCNCGMHVKMYQLPIILRRPLVNLLIIVWQILKPLAIFRSVPSWTEIMECGLFLFGCDIFKPHTLALQHIPISPSKFVTSGLLTLVNSDRIRSTFTLSFTVYFLLSY